MKKILLVFLICVLTAFSACSVSLNKKGNTEVTAWSPPPSSKETKTPNYGGINVKEEQVKINDKKTATAKPTKKPTDATEATETTELPIQGVPNPAGKPKIERVVGTFKNEDLLFTLRDNSFALNTDILEIFEKIGEDNVSREISSVKMAYDYADFTLYTYIDENDVERLMKVYIHSENVGTSRGTKVGDYASQLVRIYGDPIKESTGVKYYGNEKEQLEFKFSNNLITSITYIYVL